MLRLAVIGSVMSIAAPVAFAHQAPVDSHGCHRNIAHGSYHCHAGPLTGRQYDSKRDMLQARDQHDRDERARQRVRWLKQGSPR